MLKKRLRVLGVISLLVMVLLLVIVKGTKETATAEEEFPLALNMEKENLPDGFFENQREANETIGRLYEYLRNTYGPTNDPSVCADTGVQSNWFPPYFAGAYINVEGKLVVQIAEDYYSSDYRNTVWYQEFVGIVDSENFYCHAVKYSYTELLDALWDISRGGLSEELASYGVAIVDAAPDVYINRVTVHLESQEAYDTVINLLQRDIYVVSVAEDIPVFYADLYAGEGVTKSANGNNNFSVACRVRRNNPDGSHVYGFLTCAHAFSGTSNVYFHSGSGSNTLLGISYAVNQHLGGNSDVAFIETNSYVTLHDSVYLPTIATTLYHSLSSQPSSQVYNQGTVVYKRGEGTKTVNAGNITNNCLTTTIGGISFNDLVIADFYSAPGDSGCIVYSAPDSTYHAYSIGIFTAGASAGVSTYGIFSKIYNDLATLQSGPISYSVY